MAKSTGTGGLARLLAGLVTLALILLGTWYVLRESRQEIGSSMALGRHGTSGDAADAFATLPAPRRAPAPLMAESASPGDRSPSPPSAARPAYPPGIVTYTVSGRVVDEHGTPWAGAVVRQALDDATGHLLGVESSPYDIEFATPVSATTDESGRFTLISPWASAMNRTSFMEQPPTLLVQPEGMAQHAFPLLNHDGRDRDVGDLVISVKAATVLARMVDESGAPIEGVRAGIFSYGPKVKEGPGLPDFSVFNTMGLARGTSDAAGRLEMRAVWPCVAHVSFRDGSHSRREVRGVDMEPGETIDLGDVVMETGGHVAGVVHDRSGVAIASAAIWAWAAGTAYADGVGKPGADDWSRADPLAGVIESLEQSRAWHSSRSPTSSDAEGRFDRSGLSGHFLDVFVAAPGYEPQRVPDVPLDSTGLELTLAEETNLQVLVVDEVTGSPLQVASLQAFRCSKKWGHFTSGMPAFARRVTPGDGPGTFVVHTIGPQGTRLVASAPGHATTTVMSAEVKTAEGAQVVLRLEPACAIMGRVEDEAGAAVEAARVTLRRKLRESGAVEQPDGDPRGDRRQSAVVASDGRFVFASLEPGRFTVEAQAVGFHAPEQAEVDLEPGATFTVPAIVLQRQSIIRGTVHRADGTAAEGLEVSVASRGHVDVVDYKGHFELPGLAPGAYTLSVGKWTLGHPFLQADVTLADSETRALDLVIPRLPVVRGRVTAGGVGLAGCNVQAMQQKSDPPSRQYAVNASCDDDGAFVLQLEQEGQFLVTASTSTGGCSAPVPVTAAWGLDLPLDFELGAASIAGHVVDAADGTSPPGMEVQLLREGEPATDWVATDEAGRFFIHPLAAGSYVLQSRSEACPLTPLASELRLLDGQALQGVVVPVSKGAVIDGTVLDVHGQPDGSWVYFVSLADPNKATRCGAADGRFHFEGLAPGAGRLVVAGAGYADELLDEHAAASIKAMEEASLDIVLEPGEHRQVTLQKVR